MRNFFALLIAVFVFSCAAFAATATEIDAILQRKHAPDGVVFEVVQGQDTALEWAIPEIKKQVLRLREKFPALKIAVVSHGKEEFALLKEREEKFKAVHDGVRELAKQQDVPVHVCGTHASWFEKYDKDFPDYVDVAPSGPAQIRAYKDLGYIVVAVKPAT